MTVKQIAEITGRNERTVRNWVYFAADRNQKYLDRLADSTSARPADFSEDEVFEILKAGLGEKMAGVYMYNSVMSKKDESKGGLTADEITRIVTKTVTQTVTELVPRMFEQFESFLERRQLAADMSKPIYIEEKKPAVKEKPAAKKKPSVKRQLITAQVSLTKSRDGGRVSARFYVGGGNGFDEKTCVTVCVTDSMMEIVRDSSGKHLHCMSSSGFGLCRTLDPEDQKLLPFPVGKDCKVNIRGTVHADSITFDYSDAETSDIMRWER